MAYHFEWQYHMWPSVIALWKWLSAHFPHPSDLSSEIIYLGEIEMLLPEIQFSSRLARRQQQTDGNVRCTLKKVSFRGDGLTAVKAFFFIQQRVQLIFKGRGRWLILVGDNYKCCSIFIQKIGRSFPHFHYYKLDERIAVICHSQPVILIGYSPKLNLLNNCSCNTIKLGRKKRN